MLAHQSRASEETSHPLRTVLSGIESRKVMTKVGATTLLDTRGRRYKEAAKEATLCVKVPN